MHQESITPTSKMRNISLYEQISKSNESKFKFIALVTNRNGVNWRKNQASRDQFHHRSNQPSRERVLLIDNEKLILQKKAVFHDQKCTTFIGRDIVTKNSPQQFHEIDFKIIQLNEYLQNKIDENKKQQKNKGQAQFLIQACEIAEAVLGVQSLSVINKQILKEKQHELLIICDKIKEQQEVKLHLRQLHSLIIRKLFVLFGKQLTPSQKSDQKQILDSKNIEFLKSINNKAKTTSYNILPRKTISEYSNGITQTPVQNQLKIINIDKKQKIIDQISMSSRYKQQSQDSQSKINNFLNMNNKVSSFKKIVLRPSGIPDLDFDILQQQINSDTEERPILSVRGLSSSKKIQFQSNIEQSRQESIQDDNFQSLTDRPQINHAQRLFYSMCLSQKLKIPQNHPSQKLPVSKLYEEVKFKQVNQNLWDHYISSALKNHPYSYLDKNISENQYQDNPKIPQNALKQRVHWSQYESRTPKN